MNEHQRIDLIVRLAAEAGLCELRENKNGEWNSPAWEYASVEKLQKFLDLVRRREALDELSKIDRETL